MIKTLGYLDYEHLDPQQGRYTQPIPLLIATYLAHHKRAVRREHMVDLFWPNAGCVNGINRQLKYLSQHLYDRFEATNNHVVSFSYTQLCDVIGLEPFDDFAYVIEQLRPLHKKLRATKFISKYSYSLDKQEISVSYVITEELEPLRVYNHNRAKHNLRVALCSLRKHIEVEGLEHLSCFASTDYQVVIRSLQLGDTDTALELYDGHFLEGIEEKLEAKHFDIGSKLETWIVSERRQLAWAMQAALLSKAQQAKEATEYVQMGQYATQALNFYSSCPSDTFRESCLDLIELSHQKQKEMSEKVLVLQSLPISEPINLRLNSGIQG